MSLHAYPPSVCSPPELAAPEAVLPVAAAVLVYCKNWMGDVDINFLPREAIGFDVNQAWPARS